MTKFRLSNHQLAIETGRHNNTPKDCRFCPFCPGRIEDENHFLLECANLKYLRQELLEKHIVGIVGFEFFPKNIKLKTLLSEPQYDTCKYIAHGMELRDFLVSKPKNID